MPFGTLRIAKPLGVTEGKGKRTESSPFDWLPNSSQNELVRWIE